MRNREDVWRKKIYSVEPLTGRRWKVYYNSFRGCYRLHVWINELDGAHSKFNFLVPSGSPYSEAVARSAIAEALKNVPGRTLFGE